MDYRIMVSEPVDMIHTCSRSINMYKGVVRLKAQNCWAYMGQNTYGGVLVPFIKYCPWCGELLPQVTEDA